MGAGGKQGESRPPERPVSGERWPERRRQRRSNIEGRGQIIRISCLAPKCLHEMIHLAMRPSPTLNRKFGGRNEGWSGRQGIGPRPAARPVRRCELAPAQVRASSRLTLQPLTRKASSTPATTCFSRPPSIRLRTLTRFAVDGSTREPHEGRSARVGFSRPRGIAWIPVPATLRSIRTRKCHMAIPGRR